ncbi:LapA family protein [Citrobacter amalonaticus]|nr:LapA family protein [Citrobacter amalonaticus]
MDDLLILGCIILFFALVVVPVLAIVAISRSSTTRDELARLRRRVEELEQRGVVVPTVMQTAPVPPTQTVTESEPIPVAVSESEPEPASPWRAHTQPAADGVEKIPPACSRC